MKRKILALVTIAVLLFPATLQSFTITAPEDFIPGDQFLTLDFNLTGKLKNAIEPFLREKMENPSARLTEDEVEQNKIVLDKILSGERFFVGISDSGSSAAFALSDEEWNTFIQGSEKSTYGSLDIYKDSTGVFTKIGNFLVFSETEQQLQKIGDIVDGKAEASPSLSNNSGYQNMVKSYLSPRLFSFTADIEALIKLARPFMQNETLNEPGAAVLFDILEMFQFEGGSVAEVADGYKFNFKLTGNLAKMQTKGFSFNPGGGFTPNLYKKFPNASPIAYAESFNYKANRAQSKQLSQQLQESFPGMSDLDIFAELKKETGINLDEIFDLLDEESAFALQSDSKSPLPYFTFMANVNNNREAAKKQVAKFAELAKENISGEWVTITSEGDITKIKIDPTVTENYDGPPFAKITLAFGVTSDGMLIVSNYPNIENASARTGMPFTVEAKESAGIFYLNVRNVWKLVDDFTDWIKQKDPQHAPDLSFYQGYYSVLEKIYGVKDILLVARAGQAEAMLEGTVKIDDAKHVSYDDLLENLKSQDTDDDNVSDYDEEYLYHTPVNVGDSDKDGVSDLVELQKGSNPKGKGQLFKDVDEGSYYTDEASLLYQRGAIKGYDDGTFRPGNLVNRAEFTTMVVKAFEKNTSSYLGVDIEFGAKTVPFVDVQEGAWYYSPVAKAYAAGFVSGSVDKNTGEVIFRPGDQITRAEALTILNKASKALSQTRKEASCADVPFDDVSEKDWFCAAVANGYNNGITKGKTSNTFNPNDKLTRGEAAVMILRSIEKDVDLEAEGTTSLGDFSEKLLPGGSDLLRLP
ncbi:MAG: S-layer homology domain-containing protein [Patescibacteria group bacterium]